MIECVNGSENYVPLQSKFPPQDINISSSSNLKEPPTPILAKLHTIYHSSLGLKITSYKFPVLQ
jgi:hypothetical protein